MEEKTEEFDFTLSKPVKYSYKGVDTDGTFIRLTEPTMKLMSKTVPFKAAFSAACVKIEDDKESSEDIKKDNAEKSTIDGKEMMGLLYAYTSGNEMVNLFDRARKLFLTVGVASVEGSVDLTRSILETMSPDDFENMLGEYLVNFILASRLNQEN